MYNTDLPTRAELPSAQKLFRSTLSALVVAGVLLVTIVLPSEYAIDPTGVGSVLGLTRMGEIKTQLAAEAEQQEPATSQSSTTVVTESVPVTPVAVESVTSAPVTDPVNASTPEPSVTGSPESSSAGVPADAEPSGRTDQMTITLQPNETTEVKMEMRKGARVEYRWATQSGVLNYDTHGDNKDIDYHGYGKGKASKGDSGVLEAAFDGKHGWFWRNRDSAPVTLVLDIKGDYQSIKQML